MQLRCEPAYKERSPALLDLRKRTLYVRCNESSSTRGNVRSGSKGEELNMRKMSLLRPQKPTWELTSIDFAFGPGPVVSNCNKSWTQRTTITSRLCFDFRQRPRDLAR